MRVLLTTVGLEQPGGVASYYRAIARHLQTDIRIVTVGSRGRSGWRRWRPLRFIVDLVKTSMYMVIGNCDIVHVNPSLDLKAIIRDGCAVLLAALARRKVLVYVFGWSAGFEKKLAKHFLPFFRWVFFRADCVVVQSTLNARVLRDWGYRGRLVVETGIVDETFIEGWGEPEITAHVLESQEHLRLLFLARLEKDKGVYQTVDAFKIVKQHFRHAELIIAGSGSESNRVSEQIQKEHIDGVKMLGHLTGPGLARAYHEADLYVLPTSHGEGMPSSILEAMACGLPVVTCPVGGIPDFFEDGVMGYLIEDTSPQNLAEHIQKLAAEKGRRLQMGIHNYRYARDRFLAPVVAARIRSLYAQIT